MRQRSRAVRGFTLVEVVLALSIAAAILAIVFGGLRVALAAWSKGEARAARLDHARGVIVLLERALDGAFPYHFVAPQAREPHVLFDGRPDRVTFATLAPPFPGAVPIAFTAVSLSSEETGLTLRQQLLPSLLVLDRLAPVLVDRETAAVRFRYLGEEPGAWQDAWDMSREETIPRAVEITLVGRGGARGAAAQVLIVPIRAAMP
ncbi:MAG TPA: prepilin-type N-terminal cleavage/methylation domain-containing protein [Candidatus Dormibacteraeota bacterium]|jgi:general secretion pathway protein J|nr:prepilin-type N-terminal cleavage/methylation domain-containing protein [Candidatus Dormibacteraeota bacterium]